VFLQQGEEKTISMILTKDDFSYYSVESKKFVVDNGSFKVELGISSRDIKLEVNTIINSVSSISKVIVDKKKSLLIPSIVKAGEKIRINSGNAKSVVIYNFQGQAILISKNTEHIETKQLRQGAYLAHFVIDNVSYSEKFIVE
jgi:hypothetical protein